MSFEDAEIKEIFYKHKIYFKNETLHTFIINRVLLFVIYNENKHGIFCAPTCEGKQQMQLNLTKLFQTIHNRTLRN